MKTGLLTRTRDLIQKEGRLPFFKQIDLFRVEDGLLMGVTGSMGMGFSLEPRDLLLQPEAVIFDYENRMRKLLNALPEGLTLHFIVRGRENTESIISNYTQNVAIQDNFTRLFADSKIRMWRKHPFFTKDFFLFVCLPPAAKRSRSSMIPNLGIAFQKKAHQLSEQEFERTKESLQTAACDIAEGLKSLGIKALPLADDEIERYLFELLNPGHHAQSFPREITKPLTVSTREASLRSRLLLNPPRAEYDFFYLDGYFHQTVNLAGVPESTTVKSLRDFEKELGPEYLMTFSLDVPDQEKEKSWIKRQGNFARARNFFSRSPDHDAVAKAGEAEEFLSEVAASWDKILYASLAVLVKDKTREGVFEKSANVLRAFKRLGGADGIVDHMNHDRLFLTCLPLQGDENALAFPVPTNAAVHLLPVQGSWKGTGGKGIFLKTWRDEPLRLDLFDPRLQAKHSIMVGATGAGKSFFTTHLLLQFLMESTENEVIVIDLGGSYRKLAHAFGGAYLEVECAEEYALNPFPSKEVLFPAEGEADSTFLQFLKELLQKMIQPDRSWLASEKMILERALRKAYEALAAKESPLLADIESVLRNFEAGDDEDKRKAYQFAKELALFTQGEYGKILNRPGRFNLTARFIVFDLRKISRYPELQEILLFIIPFALKRKFENIAVKKILVLDECWQLLKETQGTELVEVFYRTARKLNAGVLSISQNPEDFLESTIAGVMTNNSPIKYVLRLKKGHERLGLFGLNESEILASRELEVRSGRYSEVFIKFDDQSVIAKIEPTPLEYWIATTDPADLSEETKSRKLNPETSDLEILESLARQFPNGVAKSTEASHA